MIRVWWTLLAANVALLLASGVLLVSARRAVKLAAATLEDARRETVELRRMLAAAQTLAVTMRRLRESMELRS